MRSDETFIRPRRTIPIPIPAADWHLIGNGTFARDSALAKARIEIDLHRKQMTTNLRGEDGEVLLRRQVSTWHEEPQKFLADVQHRAAAGGWVAILEVCGFHEWLVELLPQFGCREIVLIQAEKRSVRKTDRRDANTLGELLWLNRQRLLAGRKVQGLRRIVPPSNVERRRPPHYATTV